MGEFRMPSLGADMEAGTILEWRVAPGDRVHKGDIVALVDTEKSDIEVEVFEDGVIEELVVEPGVEVPVGTVLARIGPLGAAVPVPAAPAAAAAVPRRTKPPATRHRPAAVAAPPAPPAPPAAGPERGGEAAFVRASPRARREAAERGIDLAAVAGSGPDRAVLFRDLAAVPVPAAPPQPAPAPDRATRAAAATGTDRQAAMRRAIGALMARSKREIPHYYLATTVDMAAAMRWLADANATRPVTARLLPAVLLLKATARAARKHPDLNGFWVDGFQPSSAVHLGVAVSLRGGGLVAPAIHNADSLGLDDLMAALKDLVQRSRTGGLRSSEMSDPTITVTNLGDQGVEEVLGVIYAPQVALVGFGRIVERPWAADGMLGVRPVVRATLSADHRVSDGHAGGLFLSTIDQLLQRPEEL